MVPWYIATEKFTSRHDAWANYIAWSGLSQLDEVVSLDSMLCGRLLPETKDDYWPYIVNEDFMLDFFVDLEFLLARLPDTAERNLLCVYRNPPNEPSSPSGPVNFEFVGYDLVDVNLSRACLRGAIAVEGKAPRRAPRELSPVGDIQSGGIVVLLSQWNALAVAS